jgi:hypothetical protein
MPLPTASPPFAAAGAEVSSLGGFDTLASSKPGRGAQAAVRALTRDFEIEAARLEAIRWASGASTKLRHLAENLALCDDVTAGRDRQLAREYWEGMALALERLNAALAAGADSQAEGSA